VRTPSSFNLPSLLAQAQQGPSRAPSPSPERERVMRMILSLAEMYGEGLSDDRTDGYVEALLDVPVELLRLGFQRHIRLSKWFPKPAELRSAVDRERAERAPSDILAFTTRGQAPICARCEDSGWLFVAERTDQAQPTVKRCACYTTNPTLVTPKGFGSSEDAR
jgi:hypothetical protein